MPLRTKLETTARIGRTHLDPHVLGRIVSVGVRLSVLMATAFCWASEIADAIVIKHLARP